MPPAACPAWTLDGLVASRAGATLDLAAVAAGVAITAAPDGDRVLGLDLRSTVERRCPPVDHWLRGDDAVAVYEPADPRRLRATAVWRGAGDRAWEVIVSAQTALVESDSSIAVTCDLADGRVSWGRGHARGVVWLDADDAAVAPPEATCLVVRRPAETVLVAVHPGDARRIVLRRDAGRLHVACWLFSAALEKGVLLRSRVLAAVGPSEGSDAWAARLVAAQAAAPPPLTT